MVTREDTQPGQQAYFCSKHLTSVKPFHGTSCNFATDKTITLSRGFYGKNSNHIMPTFVPVMEWWTYCDTKHIKKEKLKACKTECACDAVSKMFCHLCVTIRGDCGFVCLLAS